MAPRRAASVLCLLACTVVQSGSAEKVTPLQKLLDMLDGLAVNGKEEKHAEEVEFTKFHEWCDNTRATKTKSIAEGAAQIEQLTADIQQAESDAAVLSGEIADLEASISKQQGEAKAATDARNSEHRGYAEEHKDLSESIDACQRAKQALSARSADVAQSLAQVRSLKNVPVHASALLQAFLEGHSADEAAEAGVPEANAYEFQSGGVVALLEKLTSKFKDQLLALEKEEMNAKANYEMLTQQLEDNIKAEKASAEAKTAQKAKRLEDASTAKGDKAATETGKADDEKTLSDATTECSVRSEEYEKNQVTRAEELRAIAKAMEILSSDSVSGHAGTYLPAAALLQKSATALAQLQATAGLAPASRKASDFLQARAKALGSKYLALAAARAAADPLAKVKKLIQDLVIKLTEEANAEADQHAYCTTELATNKQTREDKQAEVESLAAEVDQLTAESARLASEISELSDAISEIKGQQSEASKIRSSDKANNAKTVADAKEAQVAVEKATEVLRAYYSKAADSSLLQGTQRSLGQEMAGAVRAPYKGMQSESTGIFGLLEVVLSDFARLETQTLADEESAASAHEKFMAETDQSVAVKQTEVDHKENKRRMTDERNMSTKKELDLTQEELDKANVYHDKLKGECVNTGLSYEDRVKAREEEIQSLEEALKILDQSDLD